LREISFNGKLSYDDYKKYNVYHFKRRYIAISIILFLAYCIIFTGAIFNMLSSADRFLLIAIISLVLSLFTTTILILIRDKKIKNIYNSSPRMKNESTYKTIFKGILIKSEQGSSLVKWKDIIRAADKNEIVILYISPVQALIIPREYFQNDLDFSDFKDILKEKIKNKGTV